jgi:basic membrane protein A and related proteins
MRSMHPVRAVVLTAVLGMVAASCAGAADPCDPGDNAAEGGVNVGIAFDVGGLGDKSFNDAAHRGLLRAIDQGMVSEANCLEANQSGSNRDENVVTLADSGVELIWANGFAFSEHVAEIATDYPDVSFAIQDGFATTITTDDQNIVDINFKANEGSFLVGAAAGLVTEAQTVGFLGGQEGTGLIENFQAGWEAGVLATCPDCELLTEYIGDSTQAFVDPTRGEALSANMYDDGADVVYHAAGQSGLGLFKAAVEAGPDALAIGVDSDQYLTASAEEKEHILTSMLKRVDVAIFDTIDAIGNDSFQAGSQIFGLAEDGVGYATSNPDLLTEDIQTQLEDFRQQIIDGEITVPEQPGE